MSGELAAARETLRAAVAAQDIAAWATKPDVFTPPGAFVMPSDPYVSTDDTVFGTERARFDIVLVCSPGVNDMRADELDGLIEKALAAVDAADYHLRQVSQPGQISIGGQPHVGAVVECDTEIRRTP